MIFVSDMDHVEIVENQSKKISNYCRLRPLARTVKVLQHV